MRLILVAVGVVLIVVPAWFALHHQHGGRPAVKVAQRVVPKTELPPVEPVEFQSLDPDDARSFNASVPFSTAPNPAARPFRFSGGSADRARAIDCLAVGQLYEAGDDVDGERAVAQVVLNRVRHPAFPKSVCGVVFQGSERSTGCQFSFTCDGALDRWHPSPAAWSRARDVAIAALNGHVYAPVGYATHYHTDWVVPYWSASLDKIAQVKTHLFFRWTGWWGTPAAFVHSVSGNEPGIAALAALFDSHKDAAEALAEVKPAEVEAAGVAGAPGQALSIDPNSFLVTLDPHAAPDSFVAIATKTCGTRDYCKLMAWNDRSKTPAGLPLGQAQIAAMSFSYLRDKSRGYEKSLWNCSQFQRASKGECMKLQVLGTPAGTLPTTTSTLRTTPGTLTAAPGTIATAKPMPPAADGLDGVRRKPADAPKPVATATPKPEHP
ncbi:MAG: cell wall hydrolase [Sphingomonas sp.]|nr:cell wall hydrolase [Sphingomonas sp.]